MASGRRDYTWGFLNEAAIEGRYTVSFIKNFSVNIGPGSEAFLCKYVVPVGYKLLINRVIFCNTSRFRNFAIIEVNYYAIAQIYFSDDYCFTFSEQNPLCLVAGEELELVCQNADEVNSLFFGTVIGILQGVI